MYLLADFCDGWIIGCDFALENYDYDVINKRIEILEVYIREKRGKTVEKHHSYFGERNAFLWVLKSHKYIYETEITPIDMNNILKGYADIKREEAFKIEVVDKALNTNNINKEYLTELIGECQMGDVLTPDDLIKGTKKVLVDLSGRDKQGMLDRLYELRKDELEENQMDVEHVILNLGVPWDCM